VLLANFTVRSVAIVFYLTTLQVEKRSLLEVPLEIIVRIAKVRGCSSDMRKAWPLALLYMRGHEVSEQQMGLNVLSRPLERTDLNKWKYRHKYSSTES
jgi:hypothetical protein